MPMEIKEMVRQALRDGGVGVRISDAPFVYLDKNYVRILGGVKSAIEQALALKRLVVVQIRGETKAINEEAIDAVHAGAGIIMVDTGRWEDAAEVIKILKERELRSQVRIAFAGDISLDERELESLSELELDAIDIGYAILDGACLPMRFDVIEVA